MLEDTINLFVRPKVSKIFLFLLENTSEPKSISYITKKTNLQFSHAHKIIRKMESEQLISLEKIGRIQLISLTKKGTELAQKISKIYEILGVKYDAK